MRTSILWKFKGHHRFPHLVLLGLNTCLPACEVHSVTLSYGLALLTCLLRRSYLSSFGEMKETGKLCWCDIKE